MEIRLTGQKWCPLKIGGHHGLRRLRQEDVLAGRIQRTGLELYVRSEHRVITADG